MTDALSHYETIANARSSSRAYEEREVPRPLIERIVSAAARVPSWCNAQPWQLTITSKEETTRLGDALYAHAQQNPMQPDLPWPSSYDGPYKARRFECGMQLYEAAGIPRDDKAARTAQMLENFRFFGAPHIALVTAPKALGPYGALDCGGFIAAFCHAARAADVATIPQAAPAGYAPFLRAHFALPEDRDILCTIAFGFEDTSAPVNRFRTARASADDIIDWR